MQPKGTYYYCYYSEYAYVSIYIEGETPAIRQTKFLKKILEDYPNYSFLKFEVFDLPSKQAIKDEKNYARLQVN